MRVQLNAGLLILAVGGLTAQTPVVTEQQSGTTALLQAVSAVDEKTVWVSGQRGAVLRSLDGGATWQTKTVTGAPATLQYRDIHALSANLAWVVSIGNGSSSRIYRTRDGGATWALQFTNADTLAFYDCFTFFDDKHGVALSDAVKGKTLIRRTEDGGDHWNLLPESAVPAPIGSEGGYSASGGCVTSVGKKHAWIATTESRIFYSTDVGKSWTAVQTPIVHLAGVGMSAAAFRDTKHGIAVGGISGTGRQTDTTRATVAASDDGGKTWTLRNRPPPGALFGVTWVPKAGKETAVAASIGGLMYTRDGGKSWTAANTNQYWSVGAAGKTAWVVGPGGRITKIEF